MKPSKLQILYWFLRLRISRLTYHNKVSAAFIRYWKQTLAASPFYRKLVAQHSDFPTMNKQTFMEHFDEINTVSIRKADAFAVALKSEESRDFSPMINGISIGLSSGTSGNKGIFLTSATEQAVWVGAVLDRVLGWSFRKRRVAFFLRANNNLYESVKSGLIQFHFFDILQPMDGLVQELIKADVHILVAQPSVLFEIARRFQSSGHQAHFTKVVSVAEVLEDDQKLYFQRIFGCRIDQVYQCTEGFLAHTCKAGSLHFNEDWLTIDKHYLDDHKVRFHPIITDHLRRSQPVVRYELNDIIHEGKPCSCGSKMSTIAKIEGRSDDVFRFDTPSGEKIVFPDFVRRAVIKSSDLIQNYQVTLVGRYLLKVSLIVSDMEALQLTFALVQERLNSLFESFEIPGIKIELREWNHDPMKKFKRISNELTSSTHPK